MSSIRTDRELARELDRRLDSLVQISDVVRVMELIQRCVTRDDGIWWFTELYRRVTIAVEAACGRSYFLHPAWMKVLVVEFAKLYFFALREWLVGNVRNCPPAWRALFRKRYHVRRRGYSPLQFALAGVNAHIQRDLGQAAMSANARFPHLIEEGLYEDYNRVNRILDEVEVEAMRLMATGWIRRLADWMHPWDRRAAMWMIHWARSLAWQTGTWVARTRTRHPKLGRLGEWMVDWYAWFCGKLILLPYANQ